MTALDINQIKEILPHRFPFLMIDKVIEIVTGEKIHAVKNVSNNEPFFSGHFPKFPVMPGVMIIEALAQAAGILAHVSFPEQRTEGDLNLLVGIDNARFKRMVVPGDQLQLEVTFIRAKQGLGKFEAIARVNDEIVCSADLMSAKKK